MNGNRDEILDAMRKAAAKTGRSVLTYESFRSTSGIPMSRIFRYWDSWSEACVAAGVTPGTNGPENITPNCSKGKDHAIAELKRIAGVLGSSILSKSQFDSQRPAVKACTVARMFGNWRKAIEAAGLSQHPNLRDVIPLNVLAGEYLRVSIALGKTPTVNQLVRRSRYAKNTFTRKFGSYMQFQRDAILLLLTGAELTHDAREILTRQQRSIGDPPESHTEPLPHERGRHLGFRAFAFVPTYEAEVVSLFSSIADDLGFEIVAQRPAFPDCEARRATDKRRGRYTKCLIEFEHRSRDYVSHGHPLDGCDLIVCWEHNWQGCPIEVLELKSKIKTLDGWK
jgi:hypothetical protein